MSTAVDIESMWVAGVILIGAYLLIFSERMHRTYAALAGAVVMVGVGVWRGFYTQEAAILAIDGNTIFLLLGMMLLVALLRRTGMFEYLAIRLAKASTWTWRCWTRCCSRATVCPPWARSASNLSEWETSSGLPRQPTFTIAETARYTLGFFWMRIGRLWHRSWENRILQITRALPPGRRAP